MFTRRAICGSAVCATVAPIIGTRDAEASPGASFGSNLERRFGEIERESGGRLGVAVLDTKTGARGGHRSDERFPMCSTFKLLAAAAVLKRVESGQERLDRRIPFAPADLVVNSAITKARVGEGGLTLAELCEAAMVVSDNTAGNLLLAALGGPAGLTAYARSLGDELSRLDRIEPELNEALPGDPRDTTTPAAMAENVRRLVLGNALSPPSREQLTAWLLGNRTGGPRLRARLPKEWRVADKTGTGEHGTTNDVGLFWRRDRQPVIVSAYLTGSPGTKDEQNATIAAVGEAVAEALPA